jgi:hypothetical protein
MEYPMEIDGPNGNAGSPEESPPALSTRAQKRKATTGKPNQIVSSQNADLASKFDLMLISIQKLERSYETLQHQNEEMQRQNEEMKRQNKELREDVKRLQEQVTAISEAGSPPRSNTTSPATLNRSWSSLFKGRPSISPNSSASQNQTPEPKELPGVNIDLSRTRVTLNVNDMQEVKNRILTAFQGHQPTREIRPTSIIKTNRDLQRIRVVFKSKEEAETARKHPQWLESHFPGGRLRGEPWYPIKVDRVDRLNIMNENQMQLKEGLEQELGKENGVTITKISTLGKPVAHKLYCSIVVYLKEKKDAERLLNARIMNVFGEGAFTSQYEYRPRVTRCFNCQEYGHQAFRCNKPQRCVDCSVQGHPSCGIENPRCAACKGPHRADDRGCPEFKERLRLLNHE